MKRKGTSSKLGEEREYIHNEGKTGNPLRDFRSGVRG
jgi:hypothetical protein